MGLAKAIDKALGQTETSVKLYSGNRSDAKASFFYYHQFRGQLRLLDIFHIEELMSDEQNQRYYELQTKAIELSM